MTSAAKAGGAGAPSAPRLRCRAIEPGDRDALVALLARGFPARLPGYWARALDRLAAQTAREPGRSQGVVLDSGGSLVGALLTIHWTDPEGGRRCNLSSWYADPGFSSYAPLLVGAATRDRSVTYVNISPAPHTWPIIEAQGFRRYSGGLFLAAPLLVRAPASDVRTAWGRPPPGATVDPAEDELARLHAAFGCSVIWCAVDGSAKPYVFRRRLLGGFLPVAQVVYCPGTAEIARCAGPLGRRLAARGLPLLLIDADAAVPGLPGRFFPDRLPKYFKGPARPRLGDLAFTELPLFGP